MKSLSLVTLLALVAGFASAEDYKGGVTDVRVVRHMDQIPVRPSFGSPA